MSQGNDFANYAASSDGATPSEDVWFVAVARDDIKQMNVDQLDEAFRLGIITAETAVWTEGMEAWAPLGEVADLGSEDDEAEQSPHEASYGPAGHAPAQFSQTQGVSQTHVVSEAASHSVLDHFSGDRFAGHSAVGGLGSAPSSVAPVTSSYAPGSPSAPFVQSTVPVALNVDEDMPPIRVGRRFRPERWVLAAAAIAGLGVTAYNSDLLGSSEKPVAAAAAGRPAEAPPSRAYDVGNDGVEPGAALPAPGSSASSDSASGAAKQASAVVAPSAKADDAAEAAKAAEAEPSGAAAPKKESLKGKFTKAFNKKRAAPKAARRAKPRRASARAKPPKRAKKKSATPKASSAFDPLNDSLP